MVDAVKNVFDMYYEVNDIVEIGDRWEGGNLLLQPKDLSLKPKEVPIDNFFHKIEIRSHIIGETSHVAHFRN